MAPPLPPDVAWLPSPSSALGIGSSSSHLRPALLPPPPAQGHCALLGPLALVVQALMLVLVLASLVVKRSMEHPKRHWRIFMLDTSKQFIGQAFVHLANLAISSLPTSGPPTRSAGSSGSMTAGAKAVEVVGGAVGAATGSLMGPGGMEPSPPEGVNPCSLYFLNVLIDCTLGVVVIWACLKAAKHVLVKKWAVEGWEMGVYKRPEEGSKVRVDWWAKQCALYVASLVVMKVAVLVIFGLLPGIFTFGSWMLDWLSPRAQVVFVLALFPLAMNILQFTLIDTILKHSTSSSSNLTPTPLSSPRRGGSTAYAPLPTSSALTPPGSPTEDCSKGLRKQASFTLLASSRKGEAEGGGGSVAEASPTFGRRGLNGEGGAGGGWVEEGEEEAGGGGGGEGLGFDTGERTMGRKEV